ncbi:hypothetical protein [Nocardia farcinica]|uniref:hypothetical protein n=1 Tax=Nocardia farcinica TaxID=37329 RepID=UPI0037ABE9B2
MSITTQRGLGRIGSTVAGLTAATAIVVFAAPHANATVASVTVSGATHQLGQTYTLKAKLSGASIGLLVYWTDNGQDISGPKVPWPVGESSIEWTPTTPGQHLITASQGGSTKTVVVNVIDPNAPDPDPDPDPGTDPGSGSSAGSGGLGDLLGGLAGSS